MSQIPNPTSPQRDVCYRTKLGLRQDWPAFEAKFKTLRKLEEKEDPTIHKRHKIETDHFQEIDTLKMVNKKRVHGFLANIKADYDDRLEKVKSENKQTHGRRMAKLEEITKENLPKKVKDQEKDENGRIIFKDTDLIPSEERKMIRDENDKTREKVWNEKGFVL